MITKANLLSLLEQSLHKEDQFLIDFGKSVSGSIQNAVDLSADEKTRVERSFSYLLQDTRRHSQTILELIDYVRQDSRNEF